MRAMILAAGRGERMGELTSATPKPLLRILDTYLIEYTLANLVRAGIRDIVINISYQAEQIKTILGDGKRYGVNILYSEEEKRLETGGGIFQALPLLGNDPFLVVSSDIITDYDLTKLPRQPTGLAHLVLVDNPSFHPHGDFGLEDECITMQAKPKLTFGNIGLYRPELFAACQPGHFPLKQLLFPAIAAAKVTGEYYRGIWYNIGTPQELETVTTVLRNREDLTLLS
jgi:MurNAc alpha-1-phosphate uridylyltransferase